MERLVNGVQAGSPTVKWWKAMLQDVPTAAGRVSVLEGGSGDAVVMLHGIPTHAYLWRDVARIVQLSRRVVAPDLLGFGFSEKPETADLSPSGQADMVLDVMHKLEITSFTLVGHDYGALVACEILSREPERVDRLVLTNTSLQVEDWTSKSPLNPLAVFSVPVLGEAALAMAQPFMLKRAFEFYLAEKDRLDAATMALYWQPFEEGLDRTLLRLSRENRLDEDTFHGWKAALYDYQRPALVVWGALDPTFRIDRGHDIARLLPNCRFEAFVHSNHFIQEDRPQALGRLIAAFVEGRLDE